MAPDSFTETTRTGLGSRLMNSVMGVLVGLVMFVGSIALLWWNEGNLARDKEALDEMASKVITANVDHPEASNDGKLLYLSGQITAQTPIGDGEIISPQSALLLERKVEMYQWKENKKERTEKHVGGSEETITTYEYTKGWHSGRIDSSDFRHQEGHQNPELRYDAKTVKASDAKFGAYDASQVLDNLSASEELPVTQDMVIRAGAAVEGGHVLIKVNPSSTTTDLGDLRIRFEILRPGKFSAMAVQLNSKDLTSYAAKNGKEKLLVQGGAQSAEQLVATAKSESSVFAWILRAVGFFLMWIGLNLCVAPLPTLMDILPFLGSVSRWVLGLFTFIVAFVLSALIIIVSFIAHNTIALLLTVAIVVGSFILWLKRKGKNLAPVTTSTAVTAR